MTDGLLYVFSCLFVRIDDLEMFDETYQEGVAPYVTFQMVHFRLLNVADIAYTQGSVPDGKVERDKLSNGWLVM